jgi:hypothetical protein
MPRLATLSIDLDSAFLTTFVVRGGRVPGFLRRALPRDGRVELNASWGESIAISREGDALTVRSRGLHDFAKLGDRLWLSVGLDGQRNVAILYDGNAILVGHIAARANARIVAELGIHVPVPDDDMIVRDESRRARWNDLLNRALELTEEWELRTLVSLAAIVNWTADLDAEVELVGDEGVRVSGRTLLSGLVSARSSRRREPSSVDVQEGLRLPLIAQLEDPRSEQGKRFEIIPERDEAQLLRMIGSIREALGPQRLRADLEPEPLARKIRQISNGQEG